MVFSRHDVRLGALLRNGGYVVTPLGGALSVIAEPRVLAEIARWGFQLTPQMLDSIRFAWFGADLPPDELVGAYFQYLALDYERAITIDSNQANIRLLRDLICRAGFQEGTVVDFGSGSGLSVSAFQGRTGVHLIGVDPSPRMRQAAQSKGMRCHDMAWLHRPDGIAIDGALASYVLHLVPMTEHLDALWARMRVGAPMAVNVHKRIHECFVLGHYRELGAAVVLDNVTNALSDSSNAYYVFRKVA